MLQYLYWSRLVAAGEWANPGWREEGKVIVRAGGTERITSGRGRGVVRRRRFW